MTWFLRSIKDGDTHRGTLFRGRVNAVCGIQFAPVPAFGGSALPGAPLDPDQVCPKCRDVTKAR